MQKYFPKDMQVVLPLKPHLESMLTFDWSLILPKAKGCVWMLSVPYQPGSTCDSVGMTKMSEVPPPADTMAAQTKVGGGLNIWPLLDNSSHWHTTLLWQPRDQGGFVNDFKVIAMERK